MNQLKQRQAFQLLQAIQSYEGKPFKSWSPAETYFETQIGHKVTKANIQGVCKSGDIELSTIVESTNKNPFNTRMVNLANRLEAVEKRLDIIEELLSNPKNGD